MEVRIEINSVSWIQDSGFPKVVYTVIKVRIKNKVKSPIKCFFASSTVNKLVKVTP